MTDEQRVAQWMGWRTEPDQHWWDGPNGEFAIDLPQWGTDANAWPPVFAELERRGLWFRFTLSMFRVIGDINHEDSNYRYYQLLTATPAQRLKALVTLIGEGKDA